MGNGNAIRNTLDLKPFYEAIVIGAGFSGMAILRHLKEVADRANETLVPLGTEANSWTAGANIPGKAVVVITYLGGFAKYCELIDEEVAKNYLHFKMRHEARRRRQLHV